MSEEFGEKIMDWLWGFALSLFLSLMVTAGGLTTFSVCQQIKYLRGSYTQQPLYEFRTMQGKDGRPIVSAEGTLLLIKSKYACTVDYRAKVHLDHWNIVANEHGDIAGRLEQSIIALEYIWSAR